MRLSIRTTLSVVLALSLFSGCTTQPEPPKQVTIDSTLPTPLLNGSLSDVTSMAFEWRPVEDTRVAGYYIYRSTPGANDLKLERIGKVESRFATHFTDNDLQPNTQYLYRFSTYTAGGTESVGSETMTVQTQPMIAPVSFFQSVGNMPRSAKLLWRPHPNTKISGYNLERQDAVDGEWKEIAHINGRLNAEYIDRDLKDAHIYFYRIRAVSFDKLVTDPSETAKVVTKPLPPVIGSITASNSIPKAIELTWAPSTIADLDHYNIYRSSSLNGYFQYHVKLNETRFTDRITEDGKSYFYQVSAVDKDGLESLRTEPAIQGMTLARPLAPVMYSGKIADKAVELTWQNNDPRTVSFTVIKTTKTSWITREMMEINNITGTSFRDADIKPDTPYLYEIVSIDQNGIRSLPTEAIELSYEAK